MTTRDIHPVGTFGLCVQPEKRYAGRQPVPVVTVVRRVIGRLRTFNLATDDQSGGHVGIGTALDGTVQAFLAVLHALSAVSWPVDRVDPCGDVAGL